MKKLRCSGCKSTDLYLKEVWQGNYITFNYEDGKITGKGNLEAGNPTKVVACCNNCSKEWKIKGVTQITDLKDES